MVRDALDALAREHEIVGVLFAGGEEKVGPAVMEDPADHYGHEVAFQAGERGAALREVAGLTRPDAVFDLSGEPVLSALERMGLAAIALDLGLEYRAAGMSLRPPPRERLGGGVPVIAVIGGGKRAGKTALAGHLARLLRARAVEPVVVAMGRGGPAEPQVVPAGGAPGLRGLADIARAGHHAASDYLEDAVLTGVATVGCRRCGEGPAGEVFGSNVVAGARIALALDPGVLIVEGSGAALPPVAADRTVCVADAGCAREQLLMHLGPYRLMRSDLVVLTGADALGAPELDALRAEIGDLMRGGPVIAVRLVPEPAEPVPPAARAAVFATSEGGAEAAARGLAATGTEAVVVSANLARRVSLERDLAAAVRAGADHYVTELKAAAIARVAATAQEAGARVVFLRNRPASLDGEVSLDEALTALFDAAREAAAPAGAVS